MHKLYERHKVSALIEINCFLASHLPGVMETQGQYSVCFSLGYDVCQTIPSEEIKYANLSICTASNHTEVDESQRFYLPAKRSSHIEA